MKVEYLIGDCLGVLKTYPDDHFDSCVTDPPYGLAFMGREWDTVEVGPFTESWGKEVLRVLKPGAHLLSFGGTRTYHRMVCALEDVGFEIRDCLMWLYGSGFPKSLDVSKAIDKLRYNEPSDVLRVTTWILSRCKELGLTKDDLNKASGTSDMGGWWATTLSHRSAIPTLEQWEKLHSLLGNEPSWMTPLLKPAFEKGEAWFERPIIGEKNSGLDCGSGTTVSFKDSTGRNENGLIPITNPSRMDAQQWQGWGTALKPAYEPIVLARKPLIGTVAQNVLKHGTGGINVDGCRIGVDQVERGRANRIAPQFSGKYNNGEVYEGHNADCGVVVGRWPSNLLLDEEAAKMLDERSGESESKLGLRPRTDNNIFGTATGVGELCELPYNDKGGASRFFYIAKASRSEREKGLSGAKSPAPWAQDFGSFQKETNRQPIRNLHPTVKPLELMRYLVKLVTPKDGLCLDPFLGSGTTLLACRLEGFNGLGIEKESDYEPIIKERLAYIPPPLDSFGEVAT